jgi:hypothetical protein
VVVLVGDVDADSPLPFFFRVRLARKSRSKDTIKRQERDLDGVRDVRRHSPPVLVVVVVDDSHAILNWAAFTRFARAAGAHEHDAAHLEDDTAVSEELTLEAPTSLAEALVVAAAAAAAAESCCCCC